MNRRTFVLRAAALPPAVHALATEAQTDSRGTADRNAYPSADCKLAGGIPATGQPLRDRYQLSLNRVLYGEGPRYTPEFLLEDIRATPGRRFTNFCGDLSGRWIGALSSSASTYGGNFSSLDEVVHRTLDLQHNDGYFGGTFHYQTPQDDDFALLWGNGRLLVGLLEYYALRPDASVLAAAGRIGDFLLRIAPQFNTQKMADEFGAAHFATSYICWTQQTEGLAALYVATREPRYRDLCAAISRRIERRPADHVHGYLCSVRGTLALYNATGDEQHLQRVLAAWKDVTNSGDILITGGVPEAWTPNKKRTEGCAECDWMRLNLALYRATGNPLYLDTAENVYFNEFSMNQFATGDFGHALLNQLGTPGIVDVRAWWCCTLHGLRAFTDLQQSVFRTSGKEVFYDLPLDGHFDSGAIVAKSNLAVDGTVYLNVTNPRSAETITVRKPAWAEDVVLTRNGKRVQGFRVDNLAAGDQLAVKYVMRLRSKVAGPSQDLAARDAVHFGPWLLGVTSATDPFYFNELQVQNRFDLDSAVACKNNSASTFDVPVAATTFAYIPAEFPEQPARVEFRPVAEQTTHPPAEWDTALLTKVIDHS